MKFLKAIFFIFAALILLFLLGERVDVSDPDVPIQLSFPLDEYLERQENRFADIKEGTEKKIFWQHADQRKTEFSVVFLHGYSASRQEVSPLCEEFAQALGANLFMTRLTGHGRGGEAMNEVTVPRLKSDALEALAIGQEIGEKVIIVGASTGATLGLWLLSEKEEVAPIHSFHAMSINMGPKNRLGELLLLPHGRLILDRVQGGDYSWEAINEEQEKYWTTQYPSAALLPMMGVVQVARRVKLEKVKTPTQFFYHKGDQVVDAVAIEKSFHNLGSEPKELVALEKGTHSDHVLAGRITAPNLTQTVLESMLRFHDSTVGK